MRALQSAARFPHFARELRLLAVTREVRRQDFVELLASVVKRYPGGHTSVLENGELLELLVRGFEVEAGAFQPGGTG